ncbi:MAG: hypothetical protein HN919_21020 [Verrucomicrobia bacterium]|jgi:general secretion pathway protein D|nr:hypothetical protein [Verrucomicrobiota bacterium]MBT7068790.1 hypothetical protein [Verrucomicrobiota bacterium]MBT7698841.1 hypothetical protein [Verrucomicrobiota bacterium]
MIHRQRWYGAVAILGVAAACVVGFAVAQELDEDSLIVSEEILLEDAVNGALDGEAETLPEADALDVDDLLAEEDLLEDVEDELLEMDADVAEAPTVAVEPVAAAVEELDSLLDAAPAEPAVELDDDLLLDDLLDDASEAAVEPAVAVDVADDVIDMVEEIAEPVADVDVTEEAVEIVEEIAEPAEEAVEMVADDLADLLSEPAELAEPVAEVADAAVTNLDAGNDLDLLVKGAIEEALTEGVPEPPAMDFGVADVEPDPEPEPVADVMDDEPVVDLADDLMGDDLALDDLLDEPVADVVAEDPLDDLLVDDLLDEPVAVIEEPIAIMEEDVALIEEAPVEDMAGNKVAEDVDAWPVEAAVTPEPVVAEVVAPAAAVDQALSEALDVMNKQEELRRQALEAHGREVLREAERSADSRAYKIAERQFEEALRYVADRPETRKTRERIRTGMARNYFEWANALQRKGEKEAARDLGQRALGLKHPGAARFLEELAKQPAIVVDAAPPIPTRRAKQKDFVEKQDEIKELLRSGRQHLINGEFDRAQGKFEAVLQDRLDPQNTEAMRLIQKVAQKRYDRASMELNGTRTEMMTQVRKAWNPRDYGLAEAVARSGETEIKGGDEEKAGIRETIRLKMEQIKIPEIDFRQANIHDVIDFLQMASVDFDLTDVPEDEKGVNIILSLGQGEATAAATPAASDDPFASMLEDGEGAAGAGGVPLITFTARYISLLESLRIVTQVANLKYRIEGSVVMIVPFNSADGDIVVRMYNVLPAVEEKISLVGSEIGDGNNDRGGGGFIEIEAGSLNAGGADWKSFFSDMGVQWPDKSSIKYVRTIGKIVVANTEKNLAVFEQVLEVLNVVPSQIEIEARFVEVTQTDLDSLGFEWMMNDSWQVAQKNGQENLPASARQRIEIAAGNNGSLSSGTRFIPDGLGQNITAIDSVMRISSVLTNPELSLVLHMLQQRGHADLLSAPKVTTKSGNEAQIKVVTEYIYPTEFEVTPITAQQDGVSTIVGGVVEPSTFETREVGVILSVLPEVSTEGQMINLNMTPEVVSDPTWYEYGSRFTDADGNEQLLAMPQPFFHTRSVNTSISIYNGATVVMGGMITEVRTDVEDRIPFLGDLPLIGRLFRSSYENSEKRNLLIFVTARLVDPNGLPIKKQESVPLPDKQADATSE